MLFFEARILATIDFSIYIADLYKKQITSNNYKRIKKKRKGTRGPDKMSPRY